MTDLRCFWGTNRLAAKYATCSTCPGSLWSWCNSQSNCKDICQAWSLLAKAMRNWFAWWWLSPDPLYRAATADLTVSTSIVGFRQAASRRGSPSSKTYRRADRQRKKESFFMSDEGGTPEVLKGTALLNEAIALEKTQQSRAALEKYKLAIENLLAGAEKEEEE